MSLAEIQEAHHNVRKGWLVRRKMTFSALQERAERDRPAKGPMHVVRTRLSSEGVSQSAVRQAVHNAAHGLAVPGREVKYDPFDVVDVDIEWVAWRNGDGNDAPEVKGSPEEQYAAMMRDVSSDVVVLYTGGFAGTVNNAPGARRFLSSLARLTRGRCVNVKRRLAPQHPFPAPIVDILIAYLALINPPRSSLHAPVSPSNIILAGPSQAGLTMLGLLQILLHLQSHPIPSLSAPLPAGLLALSLIAEPNPNFPSWYANKQHDVFVGMSAPGTSAEQVPCALWPSSPPREHPIGYKEMLAHPLMAASLAGSWKGTCPVYTDIGHTERSIDGARLFVKNVRRSGGTVVLDEFEAMAHDFISFFPGWWQSRKVVERCAEMCVRFTAMANGGAKVQSERMLWTLDGKTHKLSIDDMEVLDLEEARNLIEEKTLAMPKWAEWEVIEAADPAFKL